MVRSSSGAFIHVTKGGKRDVGPETYRYLGPEARNGMHGREITTRAEVGTNDVLTRTAQNLADSFAESYVHPIRAAAASVVLCGVQYVSIVVPASSGQVISVANLAAAGPLHMTLLPSSQCAAGHTLQHRWAFTSTSFGHYRDIQAFPEAAQATALICRPLLERPPPVQLTVQTARKLLRRIHSAPGLSGRPGVKEGMPLPPGREAEHLRSTASQRLNLKGNPRRVVGKCRPAKRPDATATQPRVIGALLLGLDGSNHRPRKRDVEQLSNLLGPLIAPLAGKAVDVASAAYLARTLSRLSPEALPATDASDQASPSKCGKNASDSIQRMASDSWVLSTGEHALLRQLLEDVSLTKRSISEVPCGGDSSPMMSPLMSSMLVASCSSSSRSEFTFTPNLSLIDKPAGFVGGESILSRGRQRSRSEDSPRSSRQDSLRLQLRPVATNSAETEPRLFRSSNETPTASFSSSPEHFGRTILLGPDHSTMIPPIANPFATGRSPPVGSELL
ncbi:g11205 [Coccomyxa elongata]